MQIRERGVDATDHVGLVRQCAALGPAARIIVNDRLDVALAGGAAGVHLREDSIGINAARRLAPENFLVGRSVHSSATAAKAQSADYMIAGSVFETDSKPGQPVLGLDGLRAVVQAAGDCPVWALGGMTAARSRDVVACGIEGVAAIGAFLPVSPVDDLAATVHELTKVMRFSFDTAEELS